MFLFKTFLFLMMRNLYQHLVASDLDWDCFGKLKPKKNGEFPLQVWYWKKRFADFPTSSAYRCLFCSGQVEHQSFFACGKVELEMTLCEYISSGSCKLEFFRPAERIVPFGKAETNVTLTILGCSHIPFPKSMCNRFQPWLEFTGNSVNLIHRFQEN